MLLTQLFQIHIPIIALVAGWYILIITSQREQRFCNPSPFITPLISVATGIAVLHNYSTITPWIALCLCICTMALLVSILFSCPKVKTCLLSGFFFCIGGLALHAQKMHAKELFAHLVNQNITILATVTNRQLQTNQPDAHPSELIELSVSQVKKSGPTTFFPAKWALRCFVKYTTTAQVGDTVLIKNITLAQPHHAPLSNNPTYNDYLLKEGFLSSIFLMSGKQIEIVKRPAWSLKRWWWTLRNKTFDAIQSKISCRTARYFSLIFLGKKDPQGTDDLKRVFNFWGLSHYLARSGLHIVLFILMWTFILSFLPIHIMIKRILLLLVCATYGLLSWSSTPFARAFYSFLLCEGGKLFNVRVRFFHTLTTLCLLMLLFNPLQIFFLDFQLTFGLTFTLAWLSHFIQTHKPNNNHIAAKEPLT